MRKSNLKKFDPRRIAHLDREMWEAYYARRMGRLFLLLVRLMHEFFGFQYFYVLRVAYYSARAARDFQKHRGQENHQRIVSNLAKAYRIISEHSMEPFDYRKTAELELQWWLVDRYPDQYQMSRREALASHMASLYHIDPVQLEGYAHTRALAMEMQDEAEEKKTTANLDQIETLLQNSYESLYQAVQ